MSSAIKYKEGDYVDPQHNLLFMLKKLVILIHLILEEK